MRSCFHAALAALAISIPAIAHADAPMMDHGKPVHCVRDKSGDVWRIQCDPSTRTCLYAANEELSAGGIRAKPLERARECDFDDGFDRAKL
jgi:hypothetical protein